MLVANGWYESTMDYLYVTALSSNPVLHNYACMVGAKAGTNWNEFGTLLPELHAAMTE